MKPTEFKQQNITYAKDQPEYQPLPAFKDPNDPKGEVTSCWKMNFWERIRVLFTGRIWVSLLSFNDPLTPSFLTTKRSDIIITKKKK
jgi:hypothetical protein